MKIKSAFLTTVALSLTVASYSSLSSAHEGHDETPGIQAPKGGLIKSLEETHVEVISKGKEIRIYLYDKSMKVQTVKPFVVSAIAELPRSKKRDPIALTDKGDHFEATYDAKGTHRYTLVLKVMDPKTKHDDSLNFTIEPRK